MKKILAIVLASSFLFGGVAHAQVAPLPDMSSMSNAQLEELYYSLLRQLIALLQQRLVSLQSTKEVANSGIVNQVLPTESSSSSDVGTASLNQTDSNQNTTQTSPMPEQTVDIIANPDFQSQISFSLHDATKIASFIITNNTNTALDVTRLTFTTSRDAGLKYGYSSYAEYNGVRVGSGQGTSASLGSNSFNVMTSLIKDRFGKYISTVISPGQSSVVDIYVSIRTDSNLGEYVSPVTLTGIGDTTYDVKGQTLTLTN